MPKKPPKDINQLGHHIVARITGQVSDESEETPVKSPAKVAAGRKGGIKGAAVRTARLSSDERSAIAKKAAKKRWAKK